MNTRTRTLASFFSLAMAAMLLGAVVTTRIQSPEAAVPRSAASAAAAEPAASAREDARLTQPFGFFAIRPPAPFLFGQVSTDRRSLRVSIPLTDLQVSASAPRRVLVNFVTVDDSNRALDALGPGASDRLGFVTVELRRDLFMTVRDPQGDASNANFDIVGGEIRVATP